MLFFPILDSSFEIPDPVLELLLAVLRCVQLALELVLQLFRGGLELV